GARGGRAQATQRERERPFAGIAAALADLFRALDSAETARSLAPGPALVDLIPELAAGTLPAPMPALPPEAARTRLLDSVAAALRAVAPVALFLDDVQWADASSVQALGRILQRSDSTPILLLTT